MKDMSLKGEPRVFQGFGDCIRRIFIKEGPRSFFKGYAYSVCWLAPSLTVSFGIFEYLKSFYEKTWGNAWALGTAAVSIGQSLLYPLDTVRFWNNIKKY